MSWLFFMDESGHDHKTTPYEVRGGFAIHVSHLWPFISDMQQLELDSFGCRTHRYGKELKGANLVDKKRFRFAQQQEAFSDHERQKLCRSFLVKNLQGNEAPVWEEFASYGQACLLMARETLALLKKHKAVILASAISRGTRKPPNYRFDEYLRKDVVFLLERFFYLLERKKEHGLLVMDQMDEREDRRFVARLEAYFTKTTIGRYRTTWIVPTPFFVPSNLTYAVQAADICIYCINWGFRLPNRGMDAHSRSEIADMFGRDLAELQFRGQGYRDGQVFDTYGIFHVPDPYGTDPGQQKRGNAPTVLAASSETEKHTGPSLRVKI
ncbi:MAG: DUF3800 domain-containing protein [Gammaproteobacteria bacterium]|nr:DUF3800 domain-containing protein [Gammaproteobacteria bacterium]